MKRLVVQPIGVGNVCGSLKNGKTTLNRIRAILNEVNVRSFKHKIQKSGKLIWSLEI